LPSGAPGLVQTEDPRRSDGLPERIMSRIAFTTIVFLLAASLFSTAAIAAVSAPPSPIAIRLLP